MDPKVLMYMVHNGHMAEPEWDKVKSLASKDVPVLTLAPHVANSIGDRGLPVAPDWILPIFPFEPRKPCTLEALEDGDRCARGFSVQGRIERSRRNYTEVWEQIGGHRRHHTSKAVANFKLNILGESVEAFSVPEEVQDLVSVYKNPPYPLFYDVVAHSLALVPMLASPLYYKSKFSSTVLTSLITGVPIIADQRLLDAYSMLTRDAVYYQADNRTELDVMFEVRVCVFVFEGGRGLFCLCVLFVGGLGRLHRRFLFKARPQKSHSLHIKQHQQNTHFNQHHTTTKPKGRAHGAFRGVARARRHRRPARAHERARAGHDHRLAGRQGRKGQPAQRPAGGGDRGGRECCGGRRRWRP
jgi:hypothetical protein